MGKVKQVTEHLQNQDMNIFTIHKSLCPVQWHFAGTAKREMGVNETVLGSVLQNEFWIISGSSWPQEQAYSPE